MWTTGITPRVSETDGLGHINNTSVVAWLEAGRRGLFDLFNPENDFSQWRMIVVSLTIDFKHETFFGFDVEIKSCVSEVGRSSLKLSEEIWQNGVLCVTSRATYVNVDPVAKKSQEIPENIRQGLAATTCAS